MQCPKCKSGTLLATPMGGSAGQRVVCNNTECFTFFDGWGPQVTENVQVTEVRAAEFVDQSARSEFVSGLSEYG